MIQPSMSGERSTPLDEAAPDQAASVTLTNLTISPRAQEMLQILNQTFDELENQPLPEPESSLV